VDKIKLTEWIDFGILEAEKEAGEDLIKSISHNSEGLKLLTHDGKEFAIVIKEID